MCIKMVSLDKIHVFKSFISYIGILPTMNIQWQVSIPIEEDIVHTTYTIAIRNLATGGRIKFSLCAHWAEEQCAMCHGMLVKLGL